MHIWGRFPKRLEELIRLVSPRKSKIRLTVVCEQELVAKSSKDAEIALAQEGRIDFGRIVAKADRPEVAVDVDAAVVEEDRVVSPAVVKVVEEVRVEGIEFTERVISCKIAPKMSFSFLVGFDSLSANTFLGPEEEFLAEVPRGWLLFELEEPHDTKVSAQARSSSVKYIDIL